MMESGITFTSYITPEKITKKEELKTGDIVTLRNGNKLIYDGFDNFIDVNEDNDNYLSDLSDLDDDFRHRGYCKDEDNDVMKVERPVNYSTVFERDETVREMTLEEICKELGYDVKIVKEEE